MSCTKGITISADIRPCIEIYAEATQCISIYATYREKVKPSCTHSFISQLNSGHSSVGTGLSDEFGTSYSEIWTKGWSGISEKVEDYLGNWQWLVHLNSGYEYIYIAYNADYTDVNSNTAIQFDTEPLSEYPWEECENNIRLYLTNQGFTQHTCVNGVLTN